MGSKQSVPKSPCCDYCDGEEDDSSAALLAVLERALRDERPLRFIRTLIHLNPKVLLATDRYGDTVLHNACIYYAAESSLEIIPYLLQKCPQSARAVNVHGCTPLHIACWKGASLEIIRLLIHAFPRALGMTENQRGYTPLHILCISGARSKIISYAANAYPAACLVMDRENRLPVDALARWCDYHDESKKLRSCLNRVSLDAGRALLEAAIMPNSCLPKAVIAHVKGMMTKKRSRGGSSVEESARAQETIQIRLPEGFDLSTLSCLVWGRRGKVKVVQAMLKKERYKALINRMVRKNKVECNGKQKGKEKLGPQCGNRAHAEKSEGTEETVSDSWQDLDEEAHEV